MHDKAIHNDDKDNPKVYSWNKKQQVEYHRNKKKKSLIEADN